MIDQSQGRARTETNWKANLGCCSFGSDKDTDRWYWQGFPTWQGESEFKELWVSKKKKLVFMCSHFWPTDCSAVCRGQHNQKLREEKWFEFLFTLHFSRQAPWVPRLRQAPCKSSLHNILYPDICDVTFMEGSPGHLRVSLHHWIARSMKAGSACSYTAQNLGS